MSVAPQYELFDHTADLGIRVRAPSLPGLVPPGTEGLYAAIGEIVSCGGAVPWTVELHAGDPALLLRDYLAELLQLFDGERRRVTEFERVQLNSGHLTVQAQTRAVDVAKSTLSREVKAVTYHELAVRPVPGGYEATFIVDI